VYLFFVEEVCVAQGVLCSFRGVEGRFKVAIPNEGNGRKRGVER
jgi:hypothetical protein